MKQQYFFATLKDLNDLNSKYSAPDLRTLKKITKILIIDDQEVPFLDILQKNDYYIKKIDDIEDMNTVMEYDIVLCDIQGIGKKLSAKYQGAHVAKEIKKLFPYKQVIAFSAFSADAQDVSINAMLKEVDDFLTKDADESKWISVLDQCIKKHGDPVEQWKRVRKLLLKNDVATKYVAQMESNFVKAILEKNPNKFLESKNDYPSISTSMADILNGFLVSVLSKYLIGA